MTAMTEAPAIQAETRVPAARLAAFVTRALIAAGLLEADAEIVAGFMAEADLRGSDTHGVIRLPIYLRRIRAGGVNARPNIRVVGERSHAKFLDRRANGVPLPKALRDSLDAVARDFNIAPLE